MSDENEMYMSWLPLFAPLLAFQNESVSPESGKIQQDKEECRKGISPATGVAWTRRCSGPGWKKPSVVQKSTSGDKPVGILGVQMASRPHLGLLRGLYRPETARCHEETGHGLGWSAQNLDCDCSVGLYQQCDSGLMCFETWHAC